MIYEYRHLAACARDLVSWRDEAKGMERVAFASRLISRPALEMCSLGAACEKLLGRLNSPGLRRSSTALPMPTTYAARSNKMRAITLKLTSLGKPCTAAGSARG